ncbi:unnamed protein product [Blepharisma stoltei]|uniref:non-specific serine/threonine protein kinase n=1 Tax=Blepharisma stoltei TaxID=1481888 RepID=A0AAU9J9Z4_9CILI|nr:unnamed protein product [Blepharisma stoltei]
MDPTPQPKPKTTRDDFETIGTLGHGAFGLVEHVRKKDSNKEYAIKTVEKIHLKKEGKTEQAMREKDMLTKSRLHPGVVKLHYTFHDKDYLYFVMEYCPNGDLNQCIERYAQSFPYELARFYAAELVNILEFMRTKNIIHRDIKPQNILISSDHHIRLTDFGSAKIYDDDARGRSNTFVGTADYVSPEMLDEGPVSYAADLWAFACIVFQMFAGRPPFAAENQFLTFERIRSGVVQFPSHMTPQAIDLIGRILQIQPESRLGYNDINELKSHEFFNGIDIDNVYSLSCPTIQEVITPPIVHSTNVIKSGIVKKKGVWIFRKRLLVITEEPRIAYYEPNGQFKRGELNLSSEVRSEVHGRKKFVIFTPEKQYLFEDEEPEVWVDTINRLIQRFYG